MAVTVSIDKNDNELAYGAVQNGNRRIHWEAERSARTRNCWSVSLSGDLGGISKDRQNTLRALVAKALA